MMWCCQSVTAVTAIEDIARWAYSEKREHLSDEQKKVGGSFRVDLRGIETDLLYRRSTSPRRRSTNMDLSAETKAAGDS